ncbi:MAG: DUF3971 domain-containing protein [Bdellovibrionota bacterium]
MLSLVIFSSKTREFLVEQSTNYVKNRYRILIDHKEFRITRDNDQWKLRLKNLKITPLGPTPFKPLTLDELTVATDSLAIWNRNSFRPSIAITGLKADVEFLPDLVRLPSAGLDFTTQDLQAFLTKLPKDDKKDKAISSVKWDKVELTLYYGPIGQPDRADLSSSGQWSETHDLENFKLNAPILNASKLLSTAYSFSAKVPELKDPTETLLKLTALQSAQISELKMDCETSVTCLGNFGVTDLIWKGKDWIPGISGLTANIDLSPGKILATLPNQKLILDYPIVDKKKLSVSLQETTFRFEYEANAYVLALPETSLDIDTINTKVHTRIVIPKAENEGVSLAIDVEGNGADLTKVLGRLPAELIGDGTSNWLTRNILSGRVRDFKVGVNGTLPKTPLVTVNAGFEKTRLKFLDTWPQLSACRGRFLMHGLEMNIPIDSCLSNEVTAKDSHVRIHGIESDKSQIDISVKALSTVPNAFRYLAASPLKSLGNAFLSLPLLGESQTTRLQINVPLAKSLNRDVKLSGQSTLKNVSFDIKGGIYKGTSEQLELSFDKNGLIDLNAVVKGPADISQVKVTRDSDYLLGIIEPVTPAEGALRGRVKITPTSSPNFVTAQLTGYKPRNGGSSINFDYLGWDLSGKQSVSIKGNADVYNFGELCQLFGLDGKFKDGKGTMNFDLSLTNIQSTIGAQAIEGELTVDLKKGEISELPRAAVTVVDVANLNALGIKSQSLEYEFMKGDLKFQRGMLEITKSDIGLGIIEVKLNGTIDYLQRNLNMTLNITPNLGAPAAALAIGLWNPLVGLGLFGLSLFQDKASDSALNRVVTQTYKLEGPIDDSKVHLVRPFNFKDIFN